MYQVPMLIRKNDFVKKKEIEIYFDFKRLFLKGRNLYSWKAEKKLKFAIIRHFTVIKS